MKGREQEWNIGRKELVELVCHFQPACTPAHGKLPVLLGKCSQASASSTASCAGSPSVFTYCKKAMHLEEGLLTREEAEECIGIEFNPVRAGFHGGQDVWTRDVLNLGVRPDKAIAKVLIQRHKQTGV